jgi:hypothetical protein
MKDMICEYMACYVKNDRSREVLEIFSWVQQLKNCLLR